MASRGRPDHVSGIIPFFARPETSSSVMLLLLRHFWPFKDHCQAVMPPGVWQLAQPESRCLWMTMRGRIGQHMDPLSRLVAEELAVSLAVGSPSFDDHTRESHDLVSAPFVLRSHRILILTVRPSSSSSSRSSMRWAISQSPRPPELSGSVCSSTTKPSTSKPRP